MSRFKRIYHYHIRKCGGTSVNAWIDSQVDDCRRWNPEWTRKYNAILTQGDEAAANSVALKAEFAAFAHSAFHWAETIADHAPLRPFAPRDAFCFTILRDPIARIVSQVADWRRLDLSDYPSLPGAVRFAMRDAQTLSLADFLAKHGTSTLRYLFENHMTRAIAGARLGFGTFTEVDQGFLVEIAALAMRADFDLVGLAERYADTQAMIADRLGFAPPSPTSLNVTGSQETLADERKEATDLLEALTTFDRRLYASAVETFQKQAEINRFSNESWFEKHVENAVKRLEATRIGDDTVFSVRGPIVGSGYHPRDAAGLPNCRIWSGPATRSVLYMPVPAGVPLSVKLWVHGYASERQRDNLRIEIDDALVLHRFERAEGWREVVAADVVPSKPWLKLVIHLDQTLTSDQAEQPQLDNRARGISFDLYGWQPK